TLNTWLRIPTGTEMCGSTSAFLVRRKFEFASDLVLLRSWTPIRKLCQALRISRHSISQQSGDHFVISPNFICQPITSSGRGSIQLHAIGNGVHLNTSARNTRTSQLH